MAVKACKITCIVHKDITKKVQRMLAEAGLKNFGLQSGRGVLLYEQPRLFGLSTRTNIEDAPVDVYRIYVPARSGEAVCALLADGAGLHAAGRGSLFSEEVTVEENGAGIVNSVTRKRFPEGPRFATDLTGICCIVQRGQAEPVIRSLLEMGVAPTITFGEGMGVRDKLGLLRIAIPAEKELVNAVVSRYDAEQIMHILVDVGRLDQPGKGFIYLYPVTRGIISTKTRRGRRAQGASIEQIVSAIDTLKGGAQWRKMEASSGGATKRKFLRDLANLVVLSNDGKLMDLVNAAMSVGAPGATVGRFRQETTTEEVDDGVARELGDLVVGKQQVPGLVKAMTKAGLFGTETAGGVETRAIPIACTYLGGK
jgi:nitrogen regulatory protein PII